MTIVKKLLAAVAVVAFVLVAGVAVAGLMMPAEQSFENEIAIDASADEVWQVVTDKTRYTEWQTDLASVEIIDDANWVEYPKSAPEPLRFKLANDSRPGRMEFSYMMGDAMHGHWAGDITPTATGVRLRTVDSYRADGWMMKIVMGMFFDLDSFAKSWNSKLKQRVESTAGR
jgi:uncharacterized protein YndB with AHSA1/START domain